MFMQLYSLRYFIVLVVGWISLVSADNQTPDVSPIIPASDLPFRVQIELLKDREGNHFLLPNGLQSYAIGAYGGKWLLIEGRTNGLHDFANDPNNFPPQEQNTVVYVVDPVRQTVASRSLTSPSSGLTQDQIDSLSVTAAQFYQSGTTLYLTGGYGFRNSIHDFTTFDILTAIDVPGLIRWVTHHQKGDTAAQHIRQISDPVFKVTGGYMIKLGLKNPTLLVLGQDFEGTYNFGHSTQIYNKQIRRFNIHDDQKHLSVEVESPKPLIPDVTYRRRDLNVVPVIRRRSQEKLTTELVAFSGVFTESGGAWTVPILIEENGHSYMPDPNNPLTFKQGMNNYVCPTLGLYFGETGDMYTVFFGGISFGFFLNGTFQTDSEMPFINQVTAIKMDENCNFTQYLMDGEYPKINFTRQDGTISHLLFGASAQFIPADGLEKIQFHSKILKLDDINEPLVVGYILGGIQSTLPNTTTRLDSAASPYIFKVILNPIFDHS
jgi:hypothetical protein